MTSSSDIMISSSTGSDTITVNCGSYNSDTITLNNDGTYGMPAFDTITLSDYISSSTANSGIYSGTMLGTATNGSSYTTISNSTHSYNNNYWSFTNTGKPFVDSFPEWNAFRKLCEDYPGLDRAYENLKTFYTMCYADSILPKDDK